MDSIFQPWLIWFVAGTALAFLELLLPGFIILFFGIGCWVTALALLLFDLSATQQIMIFILGTIVSIVLMRRLLMRILKGPASEATVDYDDFPAGVRVQVMRRIGTHQNGRVQHRGTLWDATADEDIEAGEMAEILRFADNSHQIFFVRKI